MSEELLESYFQEIASPKDLLYTWRKRAWDHFQQLGLPKRKQEAFQYIPLQHLVFPSPQPQISEETSKEAGIYFKNGFFVSQNLPSQLIALPLTQAMRSYGIFLQNRLSRTLKEEADPLAALNGALQGNGIFLYVPPKVQIEEPIVIDQLFSLNHMASPRIHIYMGKGSKLNIIHKPRGEGFCNLVIDCAFDQNANLSFYELPEFRGKTRYFSAFRATLKRDCRLSHFSNSKGSDLSRSSLKVELTEENGEALLQGLSFLEGSCQSHIHALVEHKAPNCKSRQHFKSVLNGQSSFSFEGKIKVEPEAQKTEAYQLNNNLLLSDEAKVNAKPNLEIFADDVKASHGATFGQLDHESLFYLRSRGLSFAEAKKWLVDGFCKELLDPLPIFVKKVL